MIWPFRRAQKEKKRVTALRIVISALILGALLGAIDLFRPLEDMYRGARAELRTRPADGQTVVVGIDDRTMAYLKTSSYSRAFDAKVVDNLFALGARKVGFDITFTAPIDDAGDRAFHEMLKRHQGKVFLGTYILNAGSEKEKIGAEPISLFSEAGQFRSLKIARMPFGLSAEIFYGDRTDTSEFRSISSELADRSGQFNTRYRPDWAIDVTSVPTVSFIDVMNGKVPASAIAGKDVLIGETFTATQDYLSVVNQQWFPGVYAHAIGTQTLREGTPRNIGFAPAFLAAAIMLLVWIRARSKRLKQWTFGLGLAFFLASPFVFDAYLITADFLPAYLTIMIVAYRLSVLTKVREAHLKNSGTLMPNLNALREEPLSSSKPIIAMRIRNYAAVGATFSESVDNELITEVARRLTLPGQSDVFYQAEDVLYWLGPILPIAELEDHICGLARIMENQFVIQGRRVDVHVAFGVDTDLNRAVANRIGRALLAADTAAAKHKPYMFNTSDNDEESAWELSLMSELDAAIENGDIWIAFQPQFDLRSDQIIGAEALVRWQHPTRGAISPEAFILSAEAHNRIGKLTFHVLEIATRAAQPLAAHAPQFRLSVNISANLMETPNLPAKIVEILSKTGFPAQNLTLEVTESAPFAEDPMVGQNLAGIEAIGIDISIDDYGTGNATLEYLRSVPCQEIKIDRSFVTNLVTDNGAMLLVESTIELAHGLGRRVIAEGIEDPETLEILRAIGCDIAQGYYLAKPMRIEALDSLINLSKRIRAA